MDFDACTIGHHWVGLRYAAIARDYARLSPRDRKRTLVLDPTREGRQRLTDAIRAELVRDGTLGTDAIIATTLEPVGLTKNEASEAASYTPGQIVTFRRGSREQRLSQGRAYRVRAVNADAGTVSLTTPQGKAVAWSPARWARFASRVAARPKSSESGCLAPRSLAQIDPPTPPARTDRGLPPAL